MLIEPLPMQKPTSVISSRGTEREVSASLLPSRAMYSMTPVPSVFLITAVSEICVPLAPSKTTSTVPSAKLKRRAR